MPNSLLEPEYADAFNAWKKTPGPEANASILQTLSPVIEGAVQTHVGAPHPLLLSQARRMTLEGLRGYDPARGRLKTHLYNHLQGLKRVNRQQTTILRVPERVALDRYQLEQASQSLASTLGREPSDAELAEHTGFSTKRLGRARTYKPAVAEGTIEGGVGGQVFGSVSTPGARSTMYRDLVYEDLDPYHQRVMEMALGLHGRKPMRNGDIATKLNKSPGAISQATSRIQALLDQEHELGGAI
jgi:hypothetical protein